MELTLAGYSNNFLNLIIRPAGRSRSFKWLGRGDINNIPYNIPRPIFIPRWIPKERPEYIAKWVPTTPGPQSHKQSSHQSGFGHPKTNSIVQMQNLPPTHNVAPAPAPTPALTSAPAYVPAPVQANAVEPTDYAPPHADDIISPDNNLPATVGSLPISQEPIITKPPLPQQNVFPVIPQTAIRNTFAQVPEVPGEPSFSPLIQDEAAVGLNDFRPVNPESIIILNEGNLGSLDNTANVVSNNIGNDGTRGNFSPSDPNTILSSAEPDTFFLTEVTNVTPTELNFDESTANEGGNDFLFIVDPDSTISPLTTTLLLDEDKTFQSLQDNSGKSFVGPTIVSQTLEPIQSNIISQPNLETLFMEDVQTQISQADVASKFNQGTVFDDTLLFTQDSQSNEGLQFNQELQPTQDFHSNNNSQFIEEVQLDPVFQPEDAPVFILEQQPNDFTSQSNQGLQIQSEEAPLFIQEPQPSLDFQPNDFTSQSNQGLNIQSEDAPLFIQEQQPSLDFQPNDFTSQSNQGLQIQQNVQSNGNNEIFLVTGERIQPNEEFQQDQVAQFTNFQVGQRINFRPLPIQQHDTSTGSLIPSLPRPALVAPPVSPILASGRSISTDRSDTVRQASPSGRSISTDVAIPIPVPIPIGPLASLTLDFPQEGPGVRQARVASGMLPFGARLHPRRRARQFHSQPHYFGK